MFIDDKMNEIKYMNNLRKVRKEKKGEKKQQQKQ